MLRAILQFFVTAAGLWLAAQVVPGVAFTATSSLLWAAFLLGIVNALVRPILVFLTFPLTVVTLGLFLLVVNAAMLMLSSWLCAQLGVGFAVDGWGTALIGSIIVSVISGLINGITGAGKQNGR